MTPPHYALAHATGFADLPIPPERRLTRGWAAFPLSHDVPVALLWDNPPAPWPARLRVAVAIDERDARRITVKLVDSGRTLGLLDIRYAHIFQPFELLLSAENAAAAARHGVTLHLDGGSTPLWLLHNPDGNHGLSHALMPHLLGPVDSPASSAFIDRLASLDSLQFFGWQEGCVLVGLRDLAECGLLSTSRADAAIRAHMAMFFDAEGRLDYEDDWSRPRAGDIYGIECTLPFAVMAGVMPDHPAIHSALGFWRSLWEQQGGAIQDPDMLSAEGSYTVAYPLAVIGQQRGEPEWTAMALAQLRLRRALFDGESHALRILPDGSRTFVNWCRGVAWSLLGLTRTLAVLPDPPEDLLRDVQRLGEWALRHRTGALWPTFLGEPDTPVDTSGSAGIAAALAIAARHGWLSGDARAAASETLDALHAYLTPDGFLGGVAQVNKAGEGLQRDPYRVISQFGMGLMAQLMGALAEVPAG
ncbi:MAG: glycoside hydrolase family 88 protein [Chloroflexi bacterium]|nr:glycoside hydrolase family 88 protein [Chloroflexota bacterium]